MRHVYIIDDDTEVRTITSRMVQELDCINHPFASATDFLEALPHLRHGVVLVDLRLDDMSGIELIRRTEAVRAFFPAVLVTGFADVGVAVEAMRAGALDVVQKPLGLDRLAEVLERARGALKPRQPRLDDSVPSLAARHALTRRQTDVLHGLAAGKSNKQIAADLSLSTRTVEMHRAAVMASLRVKSLPALMRVLLEATATVPLVPKAQPTSAAA